MNGPTFYDIGWRFQGESAWWFSGENYTDIAKAEAAVLKELRQTGTAMDAGRIVRTTFSQKDAAHVCGSTKRLVRTITRQQAQARKSA